MSLSGHQSARMKSADWLTPPEWIGLLGPFDLDPCCPPNMPWRTATHYLTSREQCTICGGSGQFQVADQEMGECRSCDGLSLPWRGRVWLNPPFGQEAGKWLRKLRDHGNGIALVPARTETVMFYESVWGHASAVCFVKGRPHFYYVDGTRAPFNSGAPIALIAYGYQNSLTLAKSGLGVVTKETLALERAASELVRGAA